MRRILNILGIALLVVIAGVIYYKNIEKVKGPVFLYDRTFHTGYTILSPGFPRIALGPCNEVESTFKLRDDSAFLQFKGKPILPYKVLGADSENGLHLLGKDSVQVTVYKRFDPRIPNNNDSSGLQFIFNRRDSHGEILLFPNKKCF